MEKYQGYPEYKDSGVEWVGEIPSGWQVKPTFALFDPNTYKNVDGIETNVLSLSYGRIIQRDVEKNFGLLPESFNTYQIVDSGDIILRLTDLQNDKRSLRVGLAKQRGIITSAYLKLAAKSQLEPRFAYLLLHSYDTTKVFYGMGGGLRQSMKFEDFRRLPILLPTFDEQTQIANFLDHETAKIDTLIDKQQQLIKLLKEKRQAVISHAVTKGLNPDAPMKDSGVEWLGEVPEHWSVCKLKWKARTTSGGTPTTSKYELYYEGGDISWIRTTDLNNGVLRDAPIRITQKAVNDTACSLLPLNSVLLAMYGGAGSIGKHSLLKFESTINQAVCGILPTDSFNPEYLHRFYEFYRPFWMIGAAGTRKDPNIGQDDIKEGKVLLPPLSEQEAISSYIDEIQSRFDLLTKKAEEAITFMQERRTALISAAVTGKIDVRNWQVSEQEVTQQEAS
ncbi:restriction endonuclease subunit S [Vibrio alginolyticus]|nr:restriction endonuclease subunit S [Vibrio alginolyticus]